MRGLNRAYLEFILPSFEPTSFQGISTRFRNYSKLERISLVENEKRQWDSLRKLLVYSYAKSTFYRRRFDEAGLRPASIQSPTDLKMIPELTRNDIAHHLTELQSSDYRRESLFEAATGGTTDTPVPILRDQQSVYEKAAIQLRFNAWAGFLPGDKVFYLWGAQQDYSENPSWRWRLFDRHLMRRIWAPTSVMNSKVLESHRLMLNQLRPKIVYAYPTPLTLFCEYLRDSGLHFHRPASAICTAEPLFPEQRKVIEDVLGCRVFEHYGSREFGMIAGECEQHSGLHINPASAYTEFIPVQNSDTPGLCELLITDLLNHGMPLIRYRVNDCVVIGSSECACGRGYPLVKKIIGRTGDVFVLPNGDRVPGVSLTNRVLKVCPGLIKTQIIQESIDHFCIRFVPGPNFSPADLEALLNNLKRFLPAEIHWHFDQVEVIPRERSGKTRFCISKVATSHPSSNRVLR